MTHDIGDETARERVLRVPTAQDFREIASEFQSKSGIRAAYSSYLEFYLLPPPVADETSDEELIAWGRDKHDVKDEELETDKLEATLRMLRWLKPYDTVGGYGITARDLPTTASECPSLMPYLSQTTGKVLVLGSGFSELAVLLADMYAAEELDEPAVLVDLFDYIAAREDLHHLHDMFTARGLEFPLSVELERCDAIAAAIERGDLRAEQYLVGSGSIPAGCQDAQLIVNVYGPPEASAAEQVRMLAPGGTLVTSYNLSNEALGPDFSFRRDQSAYGITFSSLVTRL